MDPDLESQRPSITSHELSEKDAAPDAAPRLSDNQQHEHRKPALVSNSLYSSRRRSPSSSPTRLEGPVQDGSNHNRASPTPRSSRSSRRRSADAAIGGPDVPVSRRSTHESNSPPAGSLRSSRRSPSRSGSIRPADADNIHATGTAQSVDSSDLDYEDMGLFDFAEELREEKPPGEPWFMEMTRLRRLHFLWLNKELAAIRKKILEAKRASRKDMEALQSLLRDQATAIRDFQYIRSLDFLSSGQMEQRRKSSIGFFPNTAKSVDADVFPFETENYRCLPRAHKTALEPFSDEVREFMRTYLPSSITWTSEEKEAKLDWFKQGFAPTTLSPTVDRLARFTIAMAGALFILVPMYIMAIHESRTKNLVTTTVAVVLFALLCSVTLRTSNDQTLGATAGYAAVLTVFVGLTTAPESP